MITVSDIMTAKPLTLTAANTLADAASLMQEKMIRHVPIVNDEGAITGLITERDVLAAKESNIQADTSVKSSSSSVSLGQIMKTKLTTVDPHASVKAAAIYIQKHRFGCLPVVENGKLVGIITDTDFVSVAINLLELEEIHDADVLDM
ncbi:CBS domain-containing protein [Motilimonas pumila]|uniref:CBS domain-containing protein n=1 Tax=Motilimonas pumila TaxID=2303987 RepID=A0A418YEK9_9GAMM|nr:CBS domain-containing protein [Motilimonas pumila]RJG47593.1 CBS domain-containing protein [Motilimonas pumila]